MKRLASILSLLMTGLCLQAQCPTASLTNMSSYMKDRAFIISYDINDSLSSNLHRVDLAIKDNKGGIILPDSVYGDIGNAVSPGNNKKITWEIYKEYDAVYGKFEPILVLNQSRKHRRGPEYAALSLLMPGLGDYFVSDPKNTAIKPIYKTLLTASFLGLSYTAWKKREEIPPVMAGPGWYLTANSPDPIYLEEWMKKPASTDYFLFQHDAEILLGLGIASWLFDVLWVLRKGVVNQRVMKSIEGDLSLVPLKGGGMLSYRITF